MCLTETIPVPGSAHFMPEILEQLTLRDAYVRSISTSAYLQGPKHFKANTVPVQSFTSFFEIKAVNLLNAAPKDEIGVWRFSKNNPSRIYAPSDFLRCLEVKVEVKDDIPSKNVNAKAYFFDAKDNLLKALDTPSISGSRRTLSHYKMPTFFRKGQTDRFFFEIPAEVQNQKWKAVVVFGDSGEAKAESYPKNTDLPKLEFPEKLLTQNRSFRRARRVIESSPLIEHVVRTNNSQQPQITLYLRRPDGVANFSEVNGVLALCIIAERADQIKRELEKEEMSGDYAGMLSFANKHKLAILAWGSRRLWDPSKNHDDLDRKSAREADTAFDSVAAAWERGLQELAREQGVPDNKLLLWGMSASAQWAHRLCLRKPERFLATYIHICSSYDQPTPAASKVLWCVTTGELDSGYERSLNFLKHCQQLRYPIIYKAIPGLKHMSNAQATKISFAFFEFALQQKAKLSAAALKPAELWTEAFLKPYRYGDIVNQEQFPPAKVGTIPPGFRVPLPTKEIADSWEK